MVLCDTNVFIHAFNGNQQTIDRMFEIGLEKVALSAITVMELYQGMANKKYWKLLQTLFVLQTY